MTAAAARMLFAPLLLRNCCGDAGSQQENVSDDECSLPAPPVLRKAASAQPNTIVSDAAPADDIQTDLHALDREMLALILSYCEQPDLLSARAVCSQWRELADEAALRCFQTTWALASISGKPKSRASFLTLKGDAFVRQRKTSALDSLSSLAVATATDPQVLKQANNLYSDHSLAGREHIFYPVSDPKGYAGEFVHDTICGKQFVVVERDETAAGSPQALNAIAQKQREEQNFDKLRQILSRSLRIDLHQAGFYLQSAKGDMRRAMALHGQDVEWERTRRRCR